MLGSLLKSATAADAQDPDLVLVFDTTLATGTTVTVPLAGTVDVVIDWGDSTSDAYTTTGDKTHTYASEGEYTVRVSGSLTGFGANVSRPNLIKCLSFGDLGLTTLASAFRACANLVEVPITVPPSVTSMSNMFNGASVFNQNIGSWDVSNVTTMSSMFNDTTAFNQNIGSWNVSSVTTMFQMFRSALSFNNGGSADINNWVTSGVTRMDNMFFGASAFNQNIDSWNVGSVTNMNNMFFSASAMTFPLGSWQTNLASQPLSFSASANATFVAFRGTADFPLLADGTTRINT